MPVTAVHAMATRVASIPCVMCNAHLCKYMHLLHRVRKQLHSLS